MSRLFLILLLFLCACHPQSLQENVTTGVKAVAPRAPHSTSLTGAKTIEDLSKFKWIASLSDTSKYMVQVNFHDRYLTYWFHGQCMYDFFSYTYTRDTPQVYMFWSYLPDCMLDLSYLDQANGIKKHPKPREEFASFRLLSDSIVEVRYKFPEWVDKVNKIAGDSIFPKRFFIYRAHGE